MNSSKLTGNILLLSMKTLFLFIKVTAFMLSLYMVLRSFVLQYFWITNKSFIVTLVLDNLNLPVLLSKYSHCIFRLEVPTSFTLVNPSDFNFLITLS